MLAVRERESVVKALQHSSRGPCISFVCWQNANGKLGHVERIAIAMVLAAWHSNIYTEDGLELEKYFGAAEMKWQGRISVCCIMDNNNSRSSQENEHLTLHLPEHATQVC